MKAANSYDIYFRQYGELFFSDLLDWRTFKAQAMAESNLNPEAVSPVKAVGVMQLMPATSKEMAAKLGIPNEPLVPHLNIQMGIGYDLRCWKIFKKEDGIERVRFMFGAYNAGAGHIITAQRLAEDQGLPADKWSSIVQTLPQVTGFHADETIGYVARIERYLAELTHGEA